MKRILPVLIIVFSLRILLFNFLNDERGDVFSTVIESTNDKPIMRVVSYHQKCFAVCGAIYDLESYQNDDWKKVATFSHDDPNVFPAQNLKVNDEKVAYVWFSREFFLTTDGGKTWTKWEASEDKINARLTGSTVIKEAKIYSNGTGEMHLGDYGNKAPTALILKTEDYGKNWHR